jgi:hypothetical protein
MASKYAFIVSVIFTFLAITAFQILSTPRFVRVNIEVLVKAVALYKGILYYVAHPELFLDNSGKLLNKEEFLGIIPTARFLLFVVSRQSSRL